MKSGILYLADGAGQLDESGFPSTYHEKGRELRSTLSLDGKLPDLGNLNATVGTATYQVPDNRTHQEIRADGTVTTSTQTEITSRSTDLLYVEGEFLCTSRRDPDYMLDIIETALQSGSVEPARIDVDAFAESVSDREPYRSGFYDRDQPVEKGISHGNHDSDDDFRGVIQEAKLNEIGLERYDHDRKELKVYLSESGFIAIRSQVKPQEFARFVRDCVLPYAQAN